MKPVSKRLWLKKVLKTGMPQAGQLGEKSKVGKASTNVVPVNNSRFLLHIPTNYSLAQTISRLFTLGLDLWQVPLECFALVQMPFLRKLAE